MKKLIILLVFVVVVIFIFTRAPQESPEPVLTDGTGNGPVSVKFASERAVNIAGYAGDAMEPFISRDGQYLFWNGLNDGVDTNIFYAKRIDDSNFQFIGEVGGVNGEPPHLDAVPSMDADGNFYWFSTRDYPNVFENYQQGKFKDGIVTGAEPVNGDFYIRQPGWLIMDAEISPDGKLLFFVNAKFTGGTLPAEADIGVANKVNDKFIKDDDSDIIFQNINTKDDLEYAPSFASNGLEIFFTRLIKKEIATHIYTARRSSLNEPFGKPELIEIDGAVPEAPSITLDGKIFYYHKKDGERYRLYEMTRVL